MEEIMDREAALLGENEVRSTQTSTLSLRQGRLAEVDGSAGHAYTGCDL